LKDVGKLPKQILDADLPGMGQFYCLECGKHFINESTLNEHKRTKFHKKQVKRTQQEQYTQAEADAAAGMGPVQNHRGDM
jgi:bud site selection protein 20